MSEGSLLKCSDSMKRSSKFQLMEDVSLVRDGENDSSHVLALGHRKVSNQSQWSLKGFKGWKGWFWFAIDRTRRRYLVRAIRRAFRQRGCIDVWMSRMYICFSQALEGTPKDAMLLHGIYQSHLVSSLSCRLARCRALPILTIHLYFDLFSFVFT